MRGSGERSHIRGQSGDGPGVGHCDLGFRIGTSLGWLSRELMDVGGSLSRVLDTEGTGLVNGALQVLASQVCRIAVVGQIKAGKSSFINAFVQRPGLLPTNVNPWTTAVTNLHFRSGQQSDGAAVFQFFSAAEWEQLANGGGKLRELTERLVPGFKPDLLSWHVAALRKRAAARLGPEFAELLGQQHVVEGLTPDTLAQYVCQGDPGGEGLPGDLVGRYSDITKSADINFSVGPFDYPVTVTDTPGTNDPFLVRDEITRRCLDSADAYIVVLTARQALSTADVALLRILRGLNKEQIIVFLNRIDELANIAQHADEVIALVRARLRVEFPGADIPLIAGSAWWANNAMAGDDGAVERCVDRSAIDYLRYKGALPSDDRLRAVESDEDARAARRAGLLAGSGLPKVYEAVDDLLGASRFAHTVHQIAGCFLEVVRATEGATRQELQSFPPAHEVTADSAEHVHRELARLRGEMQRLEEISAVIGRSAELFEYRQTEIVTHELAGLRKRLLAKVSQCASMERGILVDLLQKGRAPRVWRFDSQPIRRELAGEFVRGFERAEAQLLELQREIVPHLRRLMAMLVPDGGSGISLDLVRRPVPLPRMTSLSSYMAVDLDSSWWSQLWKRRPTPIQRGREVERLIREEFQVVVEELVDTCEVSLAEHITATTEWSFGICEGIARSISRRRAQLMLHYESVEQRVDGSADPRTGAVQRDYVSMLRERVVECEILRHRLESIGNDIQDSLSSVSDEAKSG